MNERKKNYITSKVQGTKSQENNKNELLSTKQKYKFARRWSQSQDPKKRKECGAERELFQPRLALELTTHND